MTLLLLRFGSAAGPQPSVRLPSSAIRSATHISTLPHATQRSTTGPYDRLQATPVRLNHGHSNSRQQRKLSQAPIGSATHPIASNSSIVMTTRERRKTAAMLLAACLFVLLTFLPRSHATVQPQADGGGAAAGDQLPLAAFHSPVAEARIYPVGADLDESNDVAAADSTPPPPQPLANDRTTHVRLNAESGEQTRCTRTGQCESCANDEKVSRCCASDACLHDVYALCPVLLLSISASCRFAVAGRGLLLRHGSEGAARLRSDTRQLHLTGRSCHTSAAAKIHTVCAVRRRCSTGSTKLLAV